MGETKIYCKDFPVPKEGEELKIDDGMLNGDTPINFIETISNDKIRVWYQKFPKDE